MKTNYWAIMTLVMPLLGLTATAAETEQTSDTWIKSKIVTTFALSERLNPFEIDANVNNGMVTLNGTVQNPIESDLAEELTKGVRGVKGVNNRLIIDPKVQRSNEQSSFLHFVEDANITSRVKSRLLLDPNTHGLKIHTTTRNGVVFLEGESNSEIEADLVRQIARNTKGVVDVVSKLTITKK